MHNIQHSQLSAPSIYHQPKYRRADDIQRTGFEASLETYVFAVRASDWGSPYRRESEVNVTVQVLNINDNQPLFERVSCKGTIGCDFPVGQTIIIMSAIDIDELGLVKYKILSGNEQDVFTLNPDSGMLSLKRPLSSMSVKNEQFNLK